MAISLILACIILMEVYTADCAMDPNKIRDSRLMCPLPACTCCLETAQCQDSGHCGGQCKAGYFGRTCLNKCPHNCVLCTDHPKAFNDSSYWHKGYCTECTDGFYSTEELYQCQSDCPTSCRTCSSVTNCTVCKPEFYLYQGQCINCKTGCASCTTNENCFECQNGFYNLGGNPGNLNCIECSTGCSNQCDKKTGACTCYAGYTGDKCDNCASGWFVSIDTCYQCQSPCATCIYSLSNCLTCLDGYFLKLNTCHRCSDNCARCSSDNHCEQCKPGYYSSNTGCKPCSTGCNNRQCDITSGSCSCKVGFEGEKCDRCAPNFQPFPNCNQCHTNYHGTLCDQSCPKNCRESLCQIDNGNCIQGCVQYFTGEKCTECEIGRFGPICSEICPENCDGGCTRASGSCKTCKPNFVGDKCEGCMVSKNGTNCNLTCSAWCKADCDRNSGYCNSCVDGYYGNTCQLKCSDHCLHGTCDIKTGACDNGCIPGYSGDQCCLNGLNCKKCSNTVNCTECEYGFYDISCSRDCPANCDGRKCDRNNGTCGRCVNGYHGEFCQFMLPLSKEINDKEVSYGAVIAVIALTALVVVLVIVIFRKRIRIGFQSCRGRISDTSIYVNELQITEEANKTYKMSVHNINRQLRRYQQKEAKYSKKEAKYKEKVSQLHYELNEIRGGATVDDSVDRDASNYETLDGRATGEHPYADIVSR